MKKQFLNLGKALSKAEQKQISGGRGNVGFGTACRESSNTPCDPFEQYSCGNLSEVCIRNSSGGLGTCICPEE